MDGRGYRLGVDFGTSNTVAMLGWPDGHVRPLLFDGSPTLPSCVYADPRTGLLVGRDAAHAARISPERFEPNPKRRIDEPSVLLGDAEISTVDVIAAVLARVAGEARRVSGGQLGPVTITCPVAWAQTRRGVLTAAAERAGLGAVTLVAEPVAAAQVFLALGEANARPGAIFVVYDLGGGTFDASVVRHGHGTLEVLAAEGLSNSGGLDIDAAIVGYLGATYAARDPAAWERLAHPTTSTERRAHRLLWDDVRAAKEMLSRTSATMIHIPAYDEDAPLGRDQVELLARPILAGTVTATRAAIASAGVTVAEIAGVFLVGGGSRIPLVATLLHQALGKAPTVVEQPELVVAQGGVTAPANGSAAPFASAPSPANPISPGPVSASPVSSSPVSVSPVSPAAASSGGHASGPFAVDPASPPHGYSMPAPMSAPPVSAMPMSPGPVSPGPMSAAPVSPGFAAAPVSGQPSPGYGAPGAGGPPGHAQRPGAFGANPAAPPQQPYPTAPSGYPGAPPAAKGNRRGMLIGIVVVVLLLVGLGGWGIAKWAGAGSSKGDDGSNSITADVEHPDTDWYSNAVDYNGNEGKTVGYQCPANGEIGTVWGTGPYTADSSVCTAAVHAGYITLADGGHVIIKVSAGQDAYGGNEQHGIVTTAYDSYEWDFDIVG